MRQFLVWRNLATYRGLGFASHRHSHFYIQICLPDNGEVKLRGRSGVTHSYQIACIPSGASHEMDPVDGSMTLIYLDPLTTGLGLFAGRIPEPDHAAFEMKDLVSESKKEQVREAVQKPGAGVRSEIMRILDGCWTRSPQHKLDPRIERSIAGAEPESFCLDNLAREAGLSVSRFRHLFKEETGVAFLDYRLWLKVKQAVHHMAEHPDLALAAYDAGFADQAHFSRVFRRSFGMNPSEFTKRTFPFTVSFFAD
ncbi:MAG: AraC family transcriptional regulator [Leptospirales bacterium]|nr:AraC family transcriptional regulator [Leptospirales bacterium]